VAPEQASRTEERRPTLLLLVYCWDLFLALLAVFGALAALGGGLQLGTSSKAYPLGLQILGAVRAADYAALLASLASLLTRRQRWIQRTQNVVMAADIGLGALSIVLGEVTGGIDAASLLGVLLLFLAVYRSAVLTWKVTWTTLLTIWLTVAALSFEAFERAAEGVGALA